MAYKRSRKEFETDLRNQVSASVLYGTPLPPLDDSSRDDGSYVPVWKQEVTDDRGRKRLHGAFTGGFSAGYFNTVGSKEGWAPATFVSSRTNRAKDVRNQVQQKPEDYMDEEDIREQEEARNLTANEEYAGFGTADDPGHQNSLMDTIRPAEDTMGTKLLNRMGWRQGHGIGPKIKRGIDEDNDSSDLHFFAPDDVPVLSFVRKSDHKGLGYEQAAGLSLVSKQSNNLERSQQLAQSDHEDENRPGLDFASGPKRTNKIRRAGFGVGVLNDTGSDDEDPYSMGPKISYNKTLGGDKRPKKNKTLASKIANPLLKNTPVFVPKRFHSMHHTLRKCHDGRLPLTGFVLADELDKFSTMSLNDEKYKPPSVPEDWTPSHMPTTDDPSSTGLHQATAERANSSNHNSLTRGSLLGESVLPGKSVFDFLTPAARDKLMKATGKTNLPPALSEVLPGTTTPHHTSAQIPQLDSQTALQALSRLLNGGFTPYPNEPDKASRYKSYLESQANTSSSTVQLSLQIPPNMSAEDHYVELLEFARTAEIFKPVSGLIGSRFTTSTQTHPSSISAQTPALNDLLTKAPSRPKDPAEEAAAIGMFGPLTRSLINFYPTRLLCKRFGVQMPSHDMMPQTTSTSNRSDMYEAADGSSRAPSKMQGTTSNHPANIEVSSSNGQREQLAIEAAAASHESQPLMVAQAVVDLDRNEALEQERPGAAVFKAIFGSDDEDED